MNNTNIKHTNLSRQYGCRASQSFAWFTYQGVAHYATRFTREDMPSTGRIEIYTNEPDAPLACGTEFLRYAKEFGGSDLDIIVRSLIGRANADIDPACVERFAAIEMFC